MLKVSARLFPIGYIITVDTPNFDPHDFYIDGNWERIKGRVIVGVDEAQTEFNVTGKTGGSKYMQRHSHHGLYFWGSPSRFCTPNAGSDSNAFNINNGAGLAGDDSMSTGNSGSGESGNLQPYQTAYMWKLISYSN
jgi:hypothetical protein